MSDGAQNKGLFNRDNTKPPKGDLVLPLFSLKSRTAIISGSGSGIGLAVAQCFAEAGANVVIWYNSNKEAVDRAADIAKKYGVKCVSARIVDNTPLELTVGRQSISGRCNQ